MKKEDLRPIEYTVRHSHAIGSEKLAPTTHKGWFHFYEKKVSDNGEETVYAMVETENGKMKQLDSSDLKFTDRVTELKEYGNL